VSEIESGWEDRWREFHHGVLIGRLWVGPPWEVAPPDATTVVIDPGRAFGTGAHATTRLCLELLLDQPHGSLLDVGCGSGVLAIAAARLGFGPVTAIDNDPAATEVTGENARANGVEIDVSTADLLDDTLPGADLVTANITLAAVVALGARLDRDGHPARLIAAGYLASDGLDLPGYVRRGHRELAGWAADVFERR
jgi:ribosomal protein L11 methyltransferase